ncbi:MAG: type II toxin-antitoxin system VapC family toxin [Candidatus Aenigmarchaeota archaeon]|nr:type II toxin-antitoxin system VapC family toxin [Candidatus Aenigmarchaeota archaeon]
MMYIDTNIFVYAIENHPKYGVSCKKILEDVENKKIDVACSTLVLTELINVLVKIKKVAGDKLNVKESISAVLSLPINWTDMSIFIIENAASYKYNVSGADYIHIATMEMNSISKIISADGDFDKVDNVKRIDPLNYK